MLDLGAGTGKLTRVLADRYARVIAVEPLDELRTILAGRVPQADLRAGVAEHIPVEDGELDGVFAAQAFHWFANDEAVREIARVLRPDGVLALLWNEALDPSPLPATYRDRLGELHDAMRPASIDHDILTRSGLFRKEVEEVVEHEQVSSRDDVLAFAASVSWIASREDRDDVLAELGALLPEGTYRFRLRASMAWTRRT